MSLEGEGDEGLYLLEFGDCESYENRTDVNGGQGLHLVSGAQGDVKQATVGVEWVRRKRQQVARASRAAREKRKQETGSLRQENKRLREERDRFLRQIQNLQLEIENMREQGSIDTQLENELLKSQLVEHEKFIGVFMKLVSGVPRTQLAVQTLYKQNADYAKTHVLSLFSGSLRETWKLARIPGTIAKMFRSVAARYIFVDDFATKRSGAPKMRLNLRLDIVMESVDVDTTADLYWKLWTNVTEQSLVYGLDNSTDSYEFKRLFLENLENDTENGEKPLVSAAYYRERNPPPMKDKDWVFVSTKSIQTMALSTITNERKVLDVRNAAGGEGGKRRKCGGVRRCQILARSTTQHLKAPNDENTQRITSLLVEGCILWSDLDDNDQPLTRLSVVLSLPEDIELRELHGFESIITSKGRLNDRFSLYLTRFMNALRNAA